MYETHESNHLLDSENSVDKWNISQFLILFKSKVILFAFSEITDLNIYSSVMLRDMGCNVAKKIFLLKWYVWW